MCYLLFLCNLSLNVLPVAQAEQRQCHGFSSQGKQELINIQSPRFKVQGFFICHIIVIQGITRSEMQSNQVRSVTVQNNKNTNYISNITQGHTYGKKRRNKNKMCNEIKKCKTIRCAKNNKMCKRQWDVQKTMRCAKKQQDVQKNNKMYKKRKQKTVYWDLINSNVNKRDVQTGCSWYCT